MLQLSSGKWVKVADKKTDCLQNHLAYNHPSVPPPLLRGITPKQLATGLNINL